jgi:DNA-binding NarL/FixJ family response regulator
MNILILEDDVYRQEKFKELFKNQEVHIFNRVIDAFKKCQEQTFDILCLDHDLGGKIWQNSNEPDTGYTFVRLLIENNLQKNALIYVHSMNPIGANKMVNYLYDNNYDGIWRPFHLWGI